MEVRTEVHTGKAQSPVWSFLGNPVKQGGRADVLLGVFPSDDGEVRNQAKRVQAMLPQHRRAPAFEGRGLGSFPPESAQWLCRHPLTVRG